MAEESAKLRIPYIAASQAQKHVTHNEAMTLLDTLVQLSVLDKDRSSPPVSPQEGDTYIVKPAGSGAWAGWDNSVVRFIDGEWRSYLPGAGAGAGWMAYVIDETALYVFNGSSWVAAGIQFGSSFLDFGEISGPANPGADVARLYAKDVSGLTKLAFKDSAGTESMLLGLVEAGDGTVKKLGVNTGADNTNRLAVKSNALLFSHDDVTPGTGDLRVALNKSAPDKDASFIFQDGFSTRAMFGLLADDDFLFKVSPNGSAFFNAARIFNFCGRADLRDSARRRYMEWFPNVNTTTLNANGLTTVVTGTATAVALSATSLFTQSPRIIYASAGSAGSSAGVNGAQNAVWRGSSSDRGGFFLLIRFGWEVTQAQGRCFAGLRGALTAIGNVNPSTLTDIIGIGFDSGQTTLRMLHNDASGAASAVDLGANFPSNSAQEFYELMLAAEPGGSEVRYRVERLNTGHIATGTIATDLPAASTFLTPHLWGNNGTTGAAVQIALHTMYLENASLYGSRGL